MDTRYLVSKYIRGLQRRVFSGTPLDSFPLISGDSYLLSCEFFFDCSKGQIRKVRRSSHKRRNTLFIRTSEVSNFLKFFNSSNLDNISTVVIHNGDESISEDELRALGHIFLYVYSVNIFRANSQFKPIPIGLENRNYYMNGIPNDYLPLAKDISAVVADRKIDLLLSFSTATNLEEREECEKYGLLAGATKVSGVHASKYREYLKSSKYVLSPPGNGSDCHRTWEALYYGAVPIVKRSHWPFHHLDLPVFLIDEWEELLTIDFSHPLAAKSVSWQETIWNDFFRETN